MQGKEKITSEGKCLFCGKMYAKAGINRHLATHLKEKETTGKSGKSFLVKVETAKRWGSTPYFLSLWIDGGAKMEDFDTFLRKIWLECCGHMSAFTNPKAMKKRGSVSDVMEFLEQLKGLTLDKLEEMMDEYDGEVAMDKKAKDVLHKDLLLEYEYDFGSSTELSITVMGEYSVKADKKIVLLSRNEPLEIICSICKKAPATQMCSVCMYEEGGAVYCDKCAKKHAKACEDFDDYASLPVVNSPRFGVCAYEGGTIDKERDGIFVSKEIP